MILALLAFAALSASDALQDQTAPPVAPAQQPPAQPPPIQPPPARCTSEENRRMDFWVGEWDVFGERTNNFAGYNVIEKLYGGCVLRENWRGQAGMVGGSLNLYDPTEGVWRQTWADSTNTLTEYRGRWEGDRMIFVADQRNPRDPSAAMVKMRMTFTPLPDGSVRQAYESSTDQGATWTAGPSLIYRRKDLARP